MEERITGNQLPADEHTGDHLSDWENEGGTPNRLISNETNIPVAGSDSSKRESKQKNRPVTQVTPKHHMGG